MGSVSLFIFLQPCIGKLWEVKCFYDLLIINTINVSVIIYMPWFFIFFTKSLIWFGGQFVPIAIARDRTVVLPTKFSANHHWTTNMYYLHTACITWIEAMQIWFIKEYYYYVYRIWQTDQTKTKIDGQTKIASNCSICSWISWKWNINIIYYLI
jgi:hypothetical protein